MSEEIQTFQLWQDLIEEAKNIDVTLGGEIKSKYAQWLWEHGRNLTTSPLWEMAKNKKQLIQEYAQRTGKKIRYMYYAIKAYQTFPYREWEDVEQEIFTRYPDQPISERMLLRLIGKQEKDNQGAGELAPLHRHLKNATEISLSELTEFIEDAEYVKVYKSDYQYTFKIRR